MPSIRSRPVTLNLGSLSVNSEDRNPKSQNPNPNNRCHEMLPGSYAFGIWALEFGIWDLHSVSYRRPHLLGRRFPAEVRRLRTALADHFDPAFHGPCPLPNADVPEP